MSVIIVLRSRPLNVAAQGPSEMVTLNRPEFRSYLKAMSHFDPQIPNSIISYDKYPI